MSCSHVGELPPTIFDPGTPPVCADCLARGENSWNHLRMCLICGHVACCDSTPFQHATGHFMQSEHPVMRSVEPGEDWRWCYVHRQVV